MPNVLKSVLVRTDTPIAGLPRRLRHQQPGGPTVPNRRGVSRRQSAMREYGAMQNPPTSPLRTTVMVPLTYAGLALAAGLLVPRLEHAWLPTASAGLSPAAAHAVLGAIASGMMALTAIVFSIAFVMVQFSATAYSPRLVLWLARSAVINHSIGLFTATFLYALAAMAWVDRSGSGTVPPVTVWLSIVLLVASVVLFVLLIDRVGLLQVTRVLAFAGEEGRVVIDRMYPPPRPAGAPEPATSSRDAEPADDLPPLASTLTHQGAPAVVQALDTDALVGEAVRAGGVIVMATGVGDTVLAGIPILRVHGAGAVPDERHLRRAVALGTDRTFEQDPKYAIRLLVDVAIKALSPAINDPTTAVQALDQIEDLLLRLGQRDLDVGRFRDAAGRLRLVVPLPGWDDLVVLALDEIRFCGATSVQVMRRMRALIVDLSEQVLPDRRPTLRRYLARVDKGIRRDFADTDDQEDALEHDRQGLGLPRDRPRNVMGRD